MAIPASVFGAGYMKPYVGRRPLGAFVFFYDLLLVAISLVLAAADGVLFLVAWEVMTVASFVARHLRRREASGPAGRLRLPGRLPRRHGLPGGPLPAAGPDRRRLRLRPLRGPARERHRRAGAPLRPRARRLRHQGRARPAARLAPRGPPGRAQPRLGAALGGDDQDRRLRPPPAARLPPALPVGYGILLGAIGLGSALVAITLTLGQEDLKRALAYSSVENVGLIVLGIGLGVAAAGRGAARWWRRWGSGGALFHVWNHALMKGLAFLGAGTLVHAAHSQDLEKMGGLLGPAAGDRRPLPRGRGLARRPAAARRLRLRVAALPGAPLPAPARPPAPSRWSATWPWPSWRWWGRSRPSPSPASPAWRCSARRAAAEAASAHEVPPSQLAAARAARGRAACSSASSPRCRCGSLTPAAVQLGGAQVAAALAPAAASSAAPRVVVVVLIAVVAGLIALRAARLGGRRASLETWGCGFTRAHAAHGVHGLLLLPAPPHRASSRARCARASTSRPRAASSRARAPSGPTPRTRPAPASSTRSSASSATG